MIGTLKRTKSVGVTAEGSRTNTRVTCSHLIQERVETLSEICDVTNATETIPSMIDKISETAIREDLAELKRQSKKKQEIIVEEENIKLPSNPQESLELCLKYESLKELELEREDIKKLLLEIDTELALIKSQF